MRRGIAGWVARWKKRFEHGGHAPQGITLGMAAKPGLKLWVSVLCLLAKLHAAFQ